MDPRKLGMPLIALALAGAFACGSSSQPGTPDGSGGGAVDAGQVDSNGAVGTCDMTGVWVVAQVVYAEALGANQKTVNWLYHDITQDADGTFTINKSLNCGFRVSGTVTVTLKDSGLEALATTGLNSVGRKGSFKATTDGTMCQLDLERTY